jgi:hypothetical protein
MKVVTGSPTAHRAPLEVADRAYLLGPYQLEAADVASGQEHERRASVKLDQEGTDEVHREVGPAGGQASRYSYPSPFGDVDELHLAEPSEFQQLLGDILGRLARASRPGQP